MMQISKEHFISIYQADVVIYHQKGKYDECLLKVSVNMLRIKKEARKNMEFHKYNTIRAKGGLFAEGEPYRKTEFCS